MPNVSQVLTDRWRSGEHIGPAKPRLIVQIQEGRLRRNWRKFVFLDGSTEDFGEIIGGRNGTPWHPVWRPLGPWIDVPQVSEVSRSKSFDENGVGSATITIENIVYKRAVTAFGAYTTWVRGGMSPWRGFQMFGRPFLDQTIPEWYDVLNGGYRVRVLEGYGDAVAPVFAGLIDDTDITTTPDEIIITSRSFGQLLTDQRVFGWNKARELPSPVTFADRRKAYDVKKISAGAKASSIEGTHYASSVTRTDDTFWLSNGHTTPGNTEWVELRVPAGTYRSFWIDPHYADMECYISVFARGKSPKVDGERVDANSFIFTGQGIVPGANGGIPYVRKIRSLGGRGMKHSLGGSFELGDNSVVRFSFRKLHKGGGDGKYRAASRRIVLYKETLKKALKGKRHILVDDASDVVKWALMWAGFHEWEIESFGAPLKNPKVFHQADYLIDIVKWVESQGDYRFFIGAPSTHPDSIGVPIFRQARTTAWTSDPLEVSGTTILTKLQRKFTKEPLASIIRVRGRPTRKKEAGGQRLGEDRVRRFMASYRPPWRGNPNTGGDRLTGTLKHLTHTDKLVESVDDALVMCVLIAIQQLLAADTGQIEVPGYPGIDLDEHISVLDSASGTNSRLWTSGFTSTFRTGPDASYTMSLQGSMIDTSDMLAVGQAYILVMARVRAGE